jgi:hypothetical protein
LTCVEVNISVLWFGRFLLFQTLPSRHSAHRDHVKSSDTTQSPRVQPLRRRSLSNDGLVELCSNCDAASCTVDVVTDSVHFTPGVHGSKSGKIVVTQW